ncbi:MAG: winged helix-turn-helix domain-containing protein [Pseudomonadota bacterium]
MASEPILRSPFRLGALEVTPARNVIARDGSEFRLEPRVMDVLCMLAGAEGEVVSRESLIESLWVSEFGADESLTRAISLIRKTLREAGEADPSIETIKKRGYRLVLPVSESAPIASETPTETHPESAPTAEATKRQHEALFDPQAQRVHWLFPLAALGVLVVAAIAWFQRSHEITESWASATTTPSVVVLPFEALSDDDSDAYFGLGIAEELLNALARFPDLDVVARTSAFARDNADLNQTDLGDRLAVDHVVTGSVRRGKDRIRISSQLIRTADETSLWSNTYEFDAADLFEIEDTIVREIAQTLQVQLGVGAAADRVENTGINQSAYDQYLQGLTLWGDRMRENGNRAEALAAFQRAVAFEDNFADAWASLGTLAVYSVGSPLAKDRAAFTRMTEDALSRAIELDPTNAKAHAALVVFHVTQNLDITKARYHLEQAEAAAPNAATTHYAAVWLHRVLGDADAALAAIDRTIVLDPLNSILTLVRATLLMEMGRTDESMAALEACFEAQCLGEGFVAFASAAAVFSGEQRYLDRWRPRVDAFEKVLESIPDNAKPIVASIMPAFTSIRYQRDDADAQISRVTAMFKEQVITDTPGIWGPTFATFLPQETFMDVLHAAYERGDLFSSTFSFSPLYGVNPYPQWVLEHPRYRELWEKPGMKEVADAWREKGLVTGLPIRSQP